MGPVKVGCFGSFLYLKMEREKRRPRSEKARQQHVLVSFVKEQKWLDASCQWSFQSVAFALVVFIQSNSVVVVQRFFCRFCPGYGLSVTAGLHH